MRYAEYGRVGQHSLAGPAVATRPLDRLREAAAAEAYWVLTPEPGGAWALRHLDDTTGLLGEPVHMSDPGIGPDDAVAWAGTLVGVNGWHSLSSYPGALVDEVYTLVRSIARRPRPGRSIVVRVEPDDFDPARSCVVVRERWDATGRDSDPLYTRDPFGSDEEMLDWASQAYGLDRTGWQAGPNGEYLHR